MERDADGQPLRRLLMCGFLQSLPAIEDDAEDAYLPLGDSSQALLVKARSAYTDYIANHDAGDAAVGATPGATHDDGYDTNGGGPPDSAQGASLRRRVKRCSDTQVRLAGRTCWRGGRPRHA